MGPRYKCIYACVCVCYGEIYSRYLCQLNRGLRGQVVFPWPSCSRGVLCRPPAVGSVYMAVLYAHTRGRARTYTLGFGIVSLNSRSHINVYILYHATPGGK